LNSRSDVRYGPKQTSERQQLMSAIGGDQLSVALPARMPGSFEPFLYFGRKLHGRHAGQRRRENFLKIWHRQLGHRLAISGKHGFERFDILEFWLLCHHCRNAIEAEDHLRVQRMLDPEGTVLIEYGDASSGET